MPVQRLRGFVVGAAVLLTAFLIASAVSSGQQDDAQPAADPEVVVTLGKEPASATSAALPCAAADKPPGFRLFSLGPSFDGLPLTTIIRRCDNPSPNGRANYVSYIYGSCDPSPLPGEQYADGGCAPPLEVQIWPSCERTAADYDIGSPPELSVRRGVPSASMADRVELYTGGSTVVIFAQGPKQAEDAVDAVQAMPRDATPASLPETTSGAPQLPPPPPGAVAGHLACTEQTA